MYRDIENIRKYHKYIKSEGGEDLLNKKWTNCDIDYDLFRCSYFTKLLCLDLQKKSSGKII